MDFHKKPGEMVDYSDFKKRIKKTTYQSKNLKFDRPSLAMTEFAVDYLRDLAPRQLGRVDMYWASSMCQESYVSPCTLMVALMYARRLKLKNSQYLDTIPSSNLLLVSMMMASKFLVEVDETTLEEWVKASHMESEDLYELEMDFLKAIDWDLFVSIGDFWYFLLQLEQRIAWRQYLNRSDKFFTYTELQVLSESRGATFWSSLVRTYLDIVKILLACTATYVVMALSMASIPLLMKATTRSTEVRSHPLDRVLNADDRLSATENENAYVLPFLKNPAINEALQPALSVNDPMNILAGLCCHSCPANICEDAHANLSLSDAGENYLKLQRSEQGDASSCSVPYYMSCSINFTMARVSETHSLLRLNG